MKQPAQRRPPLRRGAFSRALFGLALAFSLTAATHAKTSDDLGIGDPDDGIQKLADPGGGGGNGPVKPGGGGNGTLDPRGGGGWKRVPFSMTDDSGQLIESEIYQIEGVRGVATAPIPEVIREQLIEDLAEAPRGDDVVFAVNAPIADEIQRSLDLGQPTEALLAYAAQDQDGGALESCGNTFRTRSRRLELTPNFSDSKPLGNGFTGSLQFEGDGNIDATGELTVEVKRVSLFWGAVCLPYGVRFEHVRAFGNVSLDSNMTLNGTISYANPDPIKLEVAKPFLAGVPFMAGPVPVYIGFNLPITVGVDIEASVTGQLQYRGGHRITGSFDYTCTINRCRGQNNIQSTVQNVDNPLGAGVTGRIQPSLYAELAVRGFLYDDNFAYAQVGVRGYLHGDLWGYYGNTCGDANQDGHYETVRALTFGLDWQIAVKAKADTFITKEWESDIWKSDLQYIGFWELIRSDAMTPMIEGPSVAGAGNTTAYKLRMRPCWPYTDPVDFTTSWGDGTTNNQTGPASSTTTAHTWSQMGTYPVQLTAWRDAHGRRFGDGRSTLRMIEVGAPLQVNLALEATAIASSTLCVTPGTSSCFSPSRVNDGDNSTSPGGFSSWANHWLAPMPHWVELRWNRTVTFSHVDLYTSQGTPIKDFDIEYWNGTEWVNLLRARGSTRLHTPVRFPPKQTSRLRVVALSGPSNAPRSARINEIEVY